MTTTETANRPRDATGASSGPPTGQVRIVGAERVGDAAADRGRGRPTGPRERPEPEERAEPEEQAEPQEERGGARAGAEDADTSTGWERGWGAPGAWGRSDELEEDESAWTALPEPPMPHWTEAPTGEVPAVLARPDAGPERTSGPEPSWREDRSDWELDEALGSPYLESPDERAASFGSEDISERQPWSFDLEPADRPRVEQGADVLDEELGDLASGGLFGERVARAAGEEPFEETAVLRARGTERRRAPSWPAPTAPVDGGPETASPEPEDVLAGERTSVLQLPRPTTPPADDEAAALAADLEEGGVLRRWHRRTRSTGRTPGPRRPVGAHAGGEGAARAPGELPAEGPAPTRRVQGAAERAPDRVSQRAGRNIPLAVASGVVVGGLTLLAFHFGTVPSMVVVTAVLALAAAEGFAAFRRAGYHPVTVLGLVAVVGVLVAAYNRTFEAIPVVVVLLVAFTFLWHLAGVDRRADPVRSSAATLLVFAWVGVFGAFAALLLAPSLFPDRHGIAYLLGALLCAVAYDIGALVAGSALGRHPLSPISPGKTWEGVAGGSVVAIAVALGAVPLIHPWTLSEAAALGVVVAVVSPLGDLAESLVKRHLGLKDMGRILPGHGGILDRIDGLLFVLPATFYLLRAFGHG